MEKLEELSVRQPRPVAPHSRWPSAKLSSFQEQQENKGVDFPSSSQSSPWMDMMKFQSLPEPETVYIDLRDAEPCQLVTSPEEKQSASDSSSEEEETMEINDPAERNMRNCSGKTLLLQQLRTARKEASELLHKTSPPSEKLEGIKQDPGSLEETGSSQINRHFKAKKVIPRKTMGLKEEKRDILLSSSGGSGGDIEKENRKEVE
ncbi:hypothetical protein M959_00409, partial [Chaetura pelagica]